MIKYPNIWTYIWINMDLLYTFQNGKQEIGIYARM